MGSKKYHDAEWLREKYEEELLTLKEIGDLCGVTRTTISDWLDRHGIDKRTQKETQRLQQEGKHTDREWLAQQYHGKERPLSDIAEECGVDPVTVMNWMERFSIPRRESWEQHREQRATYSVDQRGYRLVQTRAPEGGKMDSVYVHQLVAIANGADPHKLFGEDYHIHHKNGHKFDNRPENLEVLTNADHKRLHAAERDRAATGEFL